MRVTAVALVLLVTLALASTATAARDPRVPALQRQVTALKKQNAELVQRLNAADANLLALSNRVTVEKKAAQDYSIDAANCFRVPDWKIFGSFWRLIDVLAQATLGTQPFSPWATFDDHGSCQRVGILWVTNSRFSR